MRRGPRRRAIGVLTGRSATAFAAVAFAAVLGAVVEARTPLLPDSSWLLWVAGKWLDGAVLYRDIPEINPPLAIWLHAALVVFARAVGGSIGLVFRAGVIVWCAGCLALLYHVLASWRAAPVGRDIAVAVAATVVLALPGAFFGQREHLLLAAALPWAALVAARRDGAELPTVLVLLVAVAAAVGIALKPTHVGLWLLLPLLAGRRRWWRWPEVWTVPVLGLAYLALVASKTSYLAYAAEWGPVYWRFRHESWWRVAAGSELALLPLLAIGLAGATAKRRGVGASPLTLVLACATASAWLGAVLQGKAFPYHYWPADGLALLLLAASSRVSRRALIPVGIVWVAGVAALAIDGSSDMRRDFRHLNAVAGTDDPLVLGRNNDAAWLLVNEGGHAWLSPHYCLWWLQLSGGRDQVPGLPSWTRQDSVLRASLVPRMPPRTLLLEAGAVDVASYLRKSGEWRRILAAYQPGETVAGYRVYRRVKAGE